MKKIGCILFALVLSFMVMGCATSKEKEVVAPEPEETFSQIDVNRYAAYADALETIIDNGKWPDKSEVLSDGEGFGYIWQNRYAICDVDQDGGEELLVEITTASMAGMVMRMYDYNESSDKVELQWQGFPNAIFCDNGIIQQAWAHNQTMGNLWPYSIEKYNETTNTYTSLGSVYSEDRELMGKDFHKKKDKDNDGVIYYITDATQDMEDKASTKDEYKVWRDSYLKDANEIYIPWLQLWETNIDELKQAIKKEGAVLPIFFAVEEVISQYDVTGDGKKDSVRITCGNKEIMDPSGEWDGYGSNWTIEVNGQALSDSAWDDFINLEVHLYHVSDTRQYLEVKECWPANGDIGGYALYQVKENQLVKVADFYESIQLGKHEYHYSSNISYMTKDELILQCHNQFNATAYMQWNMCYKCIDNQWQVEGEEYELIYEDYAIDKKDGMTANQKFDVYRDVASKEVAYKVKKGDVLFLHSVCMKDGNVYFRVTNIEGQEAWLVDPEESFVEKGGTFLQGYFEEAMFAG